MGVNSSFSLLNNRFVAVYGSAFVMVAVLFFASSFTKRTDRDLRAKEINLIIRDLSCVAGHRNERRHISSYLRKRTGF